MCGWLAQVGFPRMHCSLLHVTTIYIEKDVHLSNNHKHTTVYEYYIIINVELSPRFIIYRYLRRLLTVSA